VLLVQSRPEYVLLLHVNEIYVHLKQDSESEIHNVELASGVCFQGHGVDFRLAHLHISYMMLLMDGTGRRYCHV
jgi:hypothetical protein